MKSLLFILIFAFVYFANAINETSVQCPLNVKSELEKFQFGKFFGSFHVFGYFQGLRCVNMYITKRPGLGNAHLHIRGKPIQKIKNEDKTQWFPGTFRIRGNFSTQAPRFQVVLEGIGLTFFKVVYTDYVDVAVVSVCARKLKSHHVWILSRNPVVPMTPSLLKYIANVQAADPTLNVDLIQAPLDHTLCGHEEYEMSNEYDYYYYD